MSDYLKIPADFLDENVSVSIDASVREISALLSLISFGEQLGVIDVADLESVYTQIFESIMQFGNIQHLDEE